MSRIVLNPAITEIHGSVGSTTFQRNSSGYIARLRPNRKSNTIKKTLSKFITISKRLHEWRTLSPIQQGLWRSYAAANSKLDYYGRTKTVTGYNWFVSINNHFESIGIATILNPPTYAAALAVPVFTLSVNDNGIILQPPTNYSLGNNTLIIFLTPNISGNSPLQLSALRFVYYSNTSPVVDINLKTSWQNYFSAIYPSAGSVYKLSISCMIFHVEKSSGANSAALFLNDGTDTSQIGGIGNMVINNNFIIS